MQATESLPADQGGHRTGAAQSLVARAATLDWYHTIELPDGTVTPGYFDLRRTLARIPIPASLHGKRCLDVASADGFFAFELARRGGDVVSVDLADTTRQDWQGPPGVNATRRQSTGRARRAFDLCQEAFGTSIQRWDLSVYDMTPEQLGTFDFVFMGNVLMHLGDPGRALRAIHGVTRPGGEFQSFEGIALALSLLSRQMPLAQLWDLDEPRWWTHNLAGHRRLVEAGGFTVVDQRGPWIFQPLGRLIPPWPKRPPRTWRELVFWVGVRRFGCASSVVRARPRYLEDEEPLDGRNGDPTGGSTTTVEGQA